MRAPPGLAVFDMDRTLTQRALAHELAAALGWGDRVKALSAARDAGRLSQQEVTAGIARLLAGVPVERVDAVAAGMALSPGAEEAVARLRDQGVALAVCSDSFAPAAGAVARRLGIARFAANVPEVRDGAFTGALVPYGPALDLGPSAAILDKREAVPLLARAAGVPLSRTAVIGDGLQDALAMRLVGLGIAYQGHPEARAAARHSIEGSLAPSADLVLAWLRGLA